MLEGFDYHHGIKDILWDDSTGAPLVLTLDEKVIRDLIEILVVETGITQMMGKPNVTTLIRVQQQADLAFNILANRQASQILDIREQIINFEITGIKQTESTPTTFRWISNVQFRNNDSQTLTI